MATTEGLTKRRRGGGTSSGDLDDNENKASSGASPPPRAGPLDSQRVETSYTGGENGQKIFFDPRDISESEERKKQPKLTLMEEVLLMGLKDKQVNH